MSKVAEYKTVAESDINALDSAVNGWLKEGFELYGHPYALTESEHSCACQALVRYEVTKPMVG